MCHRKKEAEDWFSYLQAVHLSVKTGRLEQKRVKIAILDTGIKLTQNQEDSYNKRDDMKYKSFLHSEMNDDTKRDDVGHGTHLAALLAGIAPEAIIHVARVFAKRKPDLTSEVKGVAEVLLNSTLSTSNLYL
jgi:hypothetical protein